MFEFSPLAFSYFTIFDIISPLVFLMRAKFEIIGNKSRLPTSYLLSGGDGGGGRGVSE